MHNRTHHWTARKADGTRTCKVPKRMQVAVHAPAVTEGQPPARTVGVRFVRLEAQRRDDRTTRYGYFRVPHMVVSSTLGKTEEQFLLKEIQR